MPLKLHPSANGFRSLRIPKDYKAVGPVSQPLFINNKGTLKNPDSFHTRNSVWTSLRCGLAVLFTKSGWLGVISQN